MDNTSALTKSHSAIAAKKRAKRNEIKEIVFDDDARRTFLTGFHKRKLARRDEAKKKALLREKQERQEEKREHRRALAERAAQNAAEIERAYGAVPENDDEWDTSGGGEMEEEFEGDEQLATVTVVQDFDLSALHEPSQQSIPPRRDAQAINTKGKDIEQVKHHVTKSKKRDKVKYQTKAARLAEKSKQRARRTEKAERAGGKASRKGRRR